MDVYKQVHNIDILTLLKETIWSHKSWFTRLSEWFTYGERDTKKNKNYFLLIGYI